MDIEPSQSGFHDAISPDLAERDLRRNPGALRTLRRSESIWISHRYPPRSEVPPRQPRWVTMLPWEYSVLPEPIAKALAKCDRIWTPSDFSRQSFIASGLPSEKISVIPNGYDPEVFKPQGDFLSLPRPSTFRFLFLGGTIYRKGIDLLLQAYGESFTNRDEVSLVIKDVGNPDVYCNQNSSELIRAFQANPANPALHYITEFLTDSAIGALYRACDVLVAPYRGEGFGLPILEAMACGVPVLITGGGPAIEFVPPSAGWRIEASPKSVGRSIFGQPCAQEAALLEPDRKHLAALLREAFETSESRRKEKGAVGARAALEKYTWDHMAAGMLRGVARMS